MGKAGRKAKFRYRLHKGDSIIAEGTIAQIAEVQEMNVDSVRNLGSPFYINRLKGKNHKWLEKIGEIDG